MLIFDSLEKNDAAQETTDFENYLFLDDFNDLGYWGWSSNWSSVVSTKSMIVTVISMTLRI